MSTRSFISIKNQDGSYNGVYCHWDGYLSNNGKILLEHYQDEEKIRKMLLLGGMSSLDNSIDKPQGHSFDTPVQGYTVFYGRDRGEAGVGMIKVSTFAELKKLAEGSFCEYFYVYQDGKWYYQDLYGKKNKLKELTEESIIKSEA